MILNFLSLGTIRRQADINSIALAQHPDVDDALLVEYHDPRLAQIVEQQQEWFLNK